MTDYDNGNGTFYAQGDGMTDVFICKRGSTKSDKIKIQLEIHPDVLEWYKARAKDRGNTTAKVIMERILSDGVFEDEACPICEKLECEPDCEAFEEGYF